MKRIKLNLLIFFLLIIILFTAFVLFLFGAVNGLNQFGNFALEEMRDNIARTSDSIFVANVDQETSMANKIFTTASALAKLIGTEAFNEKLIPNPKSFTPELKYNSDKDIYLFFDRNNIKKINDNKYGYIIASWNKNLSAEALNKYAKRFYSLSPLLENICINNDLVLGVWLVSKNKVEIEYSTDIYNNYKSINRKYLEKQAKLFIDPSKRDKNQIYWSKVYVGSSNMFVISLSFPFFDEQGHYEGIAGIDLSYDYILHELYSTKLKNLYLDYGLVRLFLDNSGNLIFCPKEYIKNFSLPKAYQPLALGKRLLYDANLLTSKDPNIVDLAKKILSKKSGKEKIVFNGEKSIVSFETIPINGWKMLAIVKSEDLYSKFDEMHEVLKYSFWSIISKSIGIFIAILTVCLIAAFWIFKSQIVKPIENFRNKIKLLGDGNFSLKIKEKGIQEIFDLAKSFNSLGVELSDYTKRLEKEIRNRESVEKEINLARRIQQNVLPDFGPEFDSSAFSLKAKLIPAKDVSGDFYDAFFLTENKIAVLVADVSGKGFPAAFFMAIARTTIKITCLAESNNPAVALEKVNNILCEKNKESMFVTAFLAYYEIDTGKFTYVNAGHLLPLLYSDGETIKKLSSKCEMPLGCMSEIEYTLFNSKLAANESFIVFTDGVTEAEAPDKEQYGDKRLDDFVNQNTNFESEVILEKLFDDLLKFQHNKVADDITALILKRKNG